MSDDIARIAGELDALERIQADMAAITSRSDDRRRHDLIELRRKLAAQIATIGTAVEPFLSTLQDVGLSQTYRQKFSRMRSAAAIHQANWPAVTLGDNPEKYQKSANSVREANRDFIDWMRAMLAGQR